MLFKDPGKIIHEYIDGRTKDYFNPIKYVLIISGVSALLVVWLKIFDAKIENINKLFEYSDDQLKLQEKIIVFIKQYINITSLLIIPFSSFISKWFYKKHKLFYGEHLIIICFLFAQITLITIASFPFYFVFPLLFNYYFLVSYIIIVIYFSFAFKKIFKSNIFKSIIGALFVNLGGMILFFFNCICRFNLCFIHYGQNGSFN